MDKQWVSYLIYEIIYYFHAFSFGFNFECNQRLGEDPEEENSVFASMNRLFEWMPLAALVGEKILCLHGGIGCSLGSIKDIFTINRPLEIVHEVNTIEE